MDRLHRVSVSVMLDVFVAAKDEEEARDLSRAAAIEALTTAEPDLGPPFRASSIGDAEVNQPVFVAPPDGVGVVAHAMKAGEYAEAWRAEFLAANPPKAR